RTLAPASSSTRRWRLIAGLDTSKPRVASPTESPSPPRAPCVASRSTIPRRIGCAQAAKAASNVAWLAIWLTIDGARPRRVAVALPQRGRAETSSTGLPPACSAPAEHVLLDREREALFVVGGSYPASRALHLAARVPHRDRQPRAGEHQHVVRLVSQRRDPLLGDLVLPTEVPRHRALVRLGVRDVEVVGLRARGRDLLSEARARRGLGLGDVVELVA